MFLVESEALYARPTLYTSDPDEHRRFLVLGRAALECCRRMNFRPHIVHVLREAGGELEAEDVFKRLEERMADALLGADQERTPEGELRWRYAARRARQTLIVDGLMAKTRPGVWELAEPGLAER